MKKILLAMTVFLLFTGLFTGCNMGDVENYAIVHAVGVDPSDKGFKVSFQVFRVASSGSMTPVDTSKTNVEIISADAQTIQNAVAQCENQLGKKMYFGHNRLLVISKNLNEIYSCIDYFSKKSDVYIGMTVAATEGSARDILDTDISSGTIAAETMERIFDVSMDQGEAVKFDFMKIVDDYIDTGGTAALPLVEKRPQAVADKSKENGEPAQDTLMVNRGIMIVDGSFGATLETNEVLGINFFESNVKEADVVVETDTEKRSVKVKSIKQKTEFSADDNGKTITKNITVRINVDSSESADAEEKLKKAVEQKIQEYLTAAVQKTLRDNTADVMGFTEWIKQKNYREYEKLVENRGEYLKSIDVKTNITAVF